MNAIIDIFIGLVFIYFLYSLWVSILSEILATWLGMRARMLRQGISHLLNDHDTRKRRWSPILGAIGDFFLFKKKNFHYTKAGEFFSHPAIKYLATERKRKIFITKKGKPAYIRRSNFATALIDMIKERSRGISEWEKIVFGLNNNSAHFQPETLRQLQSLLKDADNNMDRFVQNLENWFDEMMERVNGWYKRRLRFFLFWIGFLLVTVLNVDTLAIIDILSNDKEARTQLAQIAVTYEKQNPNPFSTISDTTLKDTARLRALEAELADIKADLGEVNTLLGLGWDFKPLSTPDSIVISSSEKSLVQNLLNFRTSIQVINAALDTIHPDSAIYAQLVQKRAGLRDTLISNYGMTFSRVDRFWHTPIGRRPMVSIERLDLDTSGNTAIITWHGNVDAKWSKKASNFLAELSPFKTKFWGIWMTALALSLGAPFWFDILKKFISIKNVGINGDEKNKSGKKHDESGLDQVHQNNRGKHITTVDKVKIALSEFGSLWKELPGVITVNDTVIDHQKGLLFTITEDGNWTKIKESIQSVFPNQNSPIPIRHEKANKASFLVSSRPRKGSVVNRSTGNWGTASGIVINEKTNKRALLCCAHVFESDPSPYLKENKNVIEDHQKKEIGKVTNQIKSNFIDAAIVDVNDHFELQDNFQAVPPAYHVSRGDVEVRTVTVHNKTRGNSSAIIIDNARDYFFSDEFGDYEMFDLIAIAKPGDSGFQQITKKGDSGALVTTLVNGVERSVGIVVGGILKSNLAYTFVIPMSEIQKVLSIKLNPTS